MKKLIITALMFVSISVLAQDHVVDKETDGKQTLSNQVAKPGHHIVKRGETLYFISKKYGLSVSEVRNLNSLKSNVLFSNQILKVSHVIEEEITEEANVVEEWVVKKGDTIYAIADASGLTVNEIRLINGLKRNILYTGQRLKLK